MRRAIAWGDQGGVIPRAAEASEAARGGSPTSYPTSRPSFEGGEKGITDDESLMAIAAGSSHEPTEFRGRREGDHGDEMIDFWVLRRWVFAWKRFFLLSNGESMGFSLGFR